MGKVNINHPAPFFELSDYEGKPVRLSEFIGKSNVLLVFNRTFL